MMRVHLSVGGEHLNAGVLRKVRAVVRERAAEMIADELEGDALTMVSETGESGAVKEDCESAGEGAAAGSFKACRLAQLKGSVLGTVEASKLVALRS